MDIEEIIINGKRLEKRKIKLSGNQEQTVFITSSTLSKKDIKDLKQFWFLARIKEGKAIIKKYSSQ